MNRHLDGDENRGELPPLLAPLRTHQGGNKVVQFATTVATATSGNKLKRKRERISEVASVSQKDNERAGVDSSSSNSASATSSRHSSSSGSNTKKFCPTICPPISEEQNKILVLKRRATTYWLQGHFEMVRVALEEALSLHQKEKSDSNSREEVFSTLSQLADACQETQDLHAAIHYRNEALAMQLECPDRWNPLAIKNLEIIAKMYLQLQMYEKALRCYENIYSIQMKDTNIDSESPQVAATLAKLALLNYSLGKHSIALRFYQEELRLRLYHSVNQNFLAEETAICLDSTGITHMEMRQFSLAKLAFLDSFRIRQALSSSHDNDNTGSMMAGGAATRTTTASAHQQHQQRLHYSMANTLVGLATAYLELEDHDVALICFEHALHIKRNLPDVVNDLQQFGRALLETGDFENASRYFRKALLALCRQRSEESIYFPEHKEVLDKLFVINGNLSMMLGDIDGMMALFTEYCRHREPEEERLDGLMIFGFTFYSINRVHPPCAPLA